MTEPTSKIKYKIKQVHTKDTGYKIAKRGADFQPKDLDRPYYPTDESIVSLASMTYRSTYEELPDEWKLLMKGKNNKDGYFGAAFFHEESSQLVISHRGTNDMKDALEDFKGVVLNQTTHQIHSACTFAFLVLSKVDSNDISISVTGHSLGAWLAQITAFAIKYLTVEDDHFRTLEKTERKYHPRTITLDSPGCYEMLCKLSDDYFPDRENEDLIRSLDITNYFIAPNKINASNHHVGKMLCFEFDSSEFESNSFMRSIFRPRSTHTMDFHNSNNFVQAFRNGNKILKVVKWPTHHVRKMLGAPFTKPFTYMDYKFKKVMLQKDVTYASETDEYTQCRRYVNQSNNFQPDEDRLRKENVDLPLKTEHYDQAVESVTVFKEDELQFLQNWKKLKRSPIRPTKIVDILRENNVKIIEDLLPDFEILEGEIKCEDAQKLRELVNRVKNLFVFLPKVNEVMNHLMSSVSSVFEAVSE